MASKKVRVLIVAQGLEFERILAAISLHHPTKLIILRSLEDVSAELRDRVNKIIEGIVDHIRSDQGRLTYPWVTDIQFDKHYINFFNISEALAQIDQIIDEEKQDNNTVTVDLSSGNKIAALALYISSMLHGIQATYCVAGKYAPSIQSEELDSQEFSTPRARSLAFSVTRHELLPGLPLEISKVPFRTLQTIIEQGGELSSIKALTELLKGPGTSIEQSDIVKVSRQVETLEGFGYVHRQRIGRKVSVRVTDKGFSVVELANAPSFNRKAIDPF